jgi:predicted aminopeptidase
MGQRRNVSAFAESFFGVLKRERVNRHLERCHNPRQRRRLEMQQRREDLVTQPSVNMG